MTLKVIAYAHNGHTDKFGIPRQSREESPILTRIVFEPEFRVAEALRGIEHFSHLWLLWGFSELSSLTANAERPQDKPAVGLSWSPTVRPPRLGGNKRMGVFATRSPFRPNPIGLSSVRLVKVQRKKVQGAKSSLELIVSGADLLDGTPIYDIKPYLSFSDSHEDAQNGFAEDTKNRTLEVDWNGLEVASIPARHWTDAIRREISYILSQDPRPGYQDDPEREYKMDYGGWRIIFVVEGARVIVKKVEKV
ncbi:MAG: tRNA (N6-threonylcarbamoyladenosine(37)-N6)-methyltransferase TrmO [Paludibacteraceae bacterium]|nr:tRNA (N6-threonylcarbamoyladenosine(37)-N6)-methyltransferase TrmO [Paludibacteraceae bacterium]